MVFKLKKIFLVVVSGLFVVASFLNGLCRPKLSDRGIASGVR